MTPETTKLVAQADRLLAMGFSGMSSRAPNCIALLDCVQDKGNAGRLSLVPSGLTFDSEQGGLTVPMHALLHCSLQERNFSDVDVPVSIISNTLKTGSGNELVRLQRLLVESRDATRLLGGSANLSEGAPAPPSAKSDEPVLDDTFQLLEKRVIVVQRLVSDGSASSSMAPMLSELRFVASNPNDALEFSVIVSSRIKAKWAQQLLADVRKACGNGKETILMTVPVVALLPVQSGFFGKGGDDLTEEMSLICICSKGIAVCHVAAAVKAEHGYAMDKWRFVEYSKLSDISLSLDDPQQFSFAFAKGSAWDPVVIHAGSPTLRWELCSTVQRLYSECCSGSYLARNLFAEKFYPASWSEMRPLTQSSAELWLSRTGLPCLKFGRQGEPQVRVIKLNTADSSLNWNSSSKKKDPLLLGQVRARFCGHCFTQSLRSRCKILISASVHRCSTNSSPSARLPLHPLPVRYPTHVLQVQRACWPQRNAAIPLH